MDKLNIDFTRILPHVIDAFSAVYGDEYRPIITKKINNAVYIPYYNYNEVSNYIIYLKKCKGREFSIRFLEEIGIDVQKYKKDNYTEPLDDKITAILDCLIDSFFGFSDFAPEPFVPLLAFDSNNNTNPKKLLEKKIKIINYLLGNNEEKINEDNFDDFTKTPKYVEILNKIDELKRIYESLLTEYKEWTKQLDYYKKYVLDESRRKVNILQEKTNEYINILTLYLPPITRRALSDKEFDHIRNTLIGPGKIDSFTNLESFSKEEMEQLKSPNVSISDKKYIINFKQLEYLKGLGITVPNEIIKECDTEEGINNYLNFLNQDEIRKYIPAEELIHYFSLFREKMYNDVMEEYYTTGKDFLNAAEKTGNNEETNQHIYNKIKNKEICVSRIINLPGHDKISSLMFFTIRTVNNGQLNMAFVHECGHIIDEDQNGCGYEPESAFYDNCIKNAYDNEYRKYEKFNETLNDIFTMEAVEYLYSKGVYIIEEREFSSRDMGNINTALITKKLLQPLVQKFRGLVIKAKVSASPQYLIEYIGEDNYEELVDAVNKVDYLSRNGLISKIEKSPEDTMVVEYFEQIERVKQIYDNIDRYYANKFSDFQSDYTEASIPKKTKIRM